jgi:hypothetical protein
LTWPEFKALLAEPEIVTEKLSATQYFPGEMLPGTRSKREADVDRVHLYCLDADGITPESLEILCRLIVAEGLEAVLHSTWSHVSSLRTEGLCRVRAIFPLKRPVLRGEWPLFWACARILLGKFADPTTAKASKHYLWPSHPPGLEADHIHHEFSGSPLDPDELLNRFGAQELISAETDILLGSQPVSATQLLDFVQNTKSKRVAKLRDAMEGALAGESYAVEGLREKTLFEIAGALASRFPTGRLSDLAEPFRRSIEDESSNGGPSFEDFCDKLRRAQKFELGKHQTQQVEERVREAKLARLREESKIYTPETLAPFLESTDGRVTLQDLNNQLLLVKGQQVWVFDGSGYRTCARSDTLHLVAETLQFRAEDVFNFQLHNPPSGESPPKRKSAEQLFLEYGKVVDHIEYNYDGLTYFDNATHTLKLSQLTANSRPAAERDERVEKYIESLSRNSRDLERLYDYFSLVPDLNRPLVILLMEGVKSGGKTAMAYMLAQVFGSPSPVAMAQAFANFNGDVLRCPVLLADEGLPEIDGRIPTDKIRSIVSEPIHSVNLKFQSPATLRGHYRIVVAMNSLTNLKFGRSAHSKEDMEAISDRFMIVNVNQHSRELFDAAHFITDGAFARHVMYLSKTHRRKDNAIRFGVDTSDSYTHILSADAHTGDLFAWLIEYLLSHVKRSVDPPLPNIKPAAFVHRGHVYVNSDAVMRAWTQFSSERRPSTPKILVEALRAVSDGTETLRLSVGQVAYWKVRQAPFRHFVLSSDIITQDQFECLMDISHEQHFTGKHRLTDGERALRAQALKRFLPPQDLATLKSAFEVERNILQQGVS